MLDVVVLFFLFGLLAGLVRSELKLPPALYDTLSLFLLLAIGLKGGVGLAQQPLLPLLPQLALVILLGVVQTLLGFALLRLKMNRVDAAATAAHYGSVSVATFAVGVITASATPAGARAAISGWRRSAAASRRSGCWPTCRVATTPTTP